MPDAPRRVVVAGLGEADPASDSDDLLVRRARVLRDAGVEVIWAGSGLSVAQVAAIAVAEDAVAVELAPASAVADAEVALEAQGAGDVEVVGVLPGPSRTDR